MAAAFEFLNPNDKPALVAVPSNETAENISGVLDELAYKVHRIDDAEQFVTQFAQVPYQVVVVDELFACARPEDNTTLTTIQNLPMTERRHAVFFLIGDRFKTLDPLQAFQQSVHAVINPAELSSLGQIILKVVADNNLFLNLYRDAQTRMAQGH